MNFKKSIMITGGAGFIGSNLVHYFVKKYPDYRIVNVDKLTYAGNLENLRGLEKKENYVFVHADICDTKKMTEVVRQYDISGIIHLAAESHVDRSIMEPDNFVMTNIVGTVSLLNSAKDAWLKRGDSFPRELGVGMTGKLFYHVSTDEVFGSLGKKGFFTEKTPYDPKSPYSASKASSDHLVRAYGHTYNLPFVISNCSNNYGAYQFPEKLIPLCIQNIINKKPLPIYSKGQNVRDWLWVEDHCCAIDLIFHRGKNGETYNIGARNEWKNIDLIRVLCKLMDKKLNRAKGESAKLITFVKDRPGHDLRYAINPRKLEKELGWKPSVTFEEGLSRTIDWYLANREWLGHVTSGAYQSYYKQQYELR